MTARPRLTRRGVLVRQALWVGVGLAVAGVMLLLGVWQMQRSMDSGAAAIAARAAEPPSPLLNHIHTDGTFDDIYGKPVTVTGEYLPGQQLLVVAKDGTLRVLTAFKVADGRVVPIVRGAVSSRDAVAAAPPPAGVQTATGLFLPGEGDAEWSVASGELGSVRMPLLAQRWPQQVTPGFVTLDAAGAAAQGLAAASVTLPQGEKSLQNGSYALQWWLFAAFALVFGLKLAHSVGEADRRAAEAEAAAEASESAPLGAAANVVRDAANGAGREEV
ncbi:MAG TPA: SURF1 family protein [Propioniciclava tarda]|nr:SURF1 family protein [Propioniciclava tarda]HQD60448.1 SURF1 family protein [Propioniciclava tarda]